MQTAKVIRRPSETSRIYVYIDHCGADTVSGRLLFFSAGEYSAFNGLTDLVMVAESVFDSLSFPQPVFQQRRFNESPLPKQTGTKERVCAVQNQEKKITDDERERHEANAAFIIHVKFRQNATWQGEIKWVSRDKTQYFRSSLEMLRLIEEALDKDYGETPKPKWD